MAGDCEGRGGLWKANRFFFGSQQPKDEFIFGRYITIIVKWVHNISDDLPRLKKNIYCTMLCNLKVLEVQGSNIHMYAKIYLLTGNILLLKHKPFQT